MNSSRWIRGWNVAATGAGLSLASVALLTACGGGSTLGTPHDSSANPTSAESNPSGDIPDNQAFVVYTPADRRFTVQVPEGWSRSDSAAGVVFTDKFNSVGIESRADVASAPTVESAKSIELPELAAGTPGYVPGEVSTVERKAGPVLRITYRADSPPSPVTGKIVPEAVERYEFYRSGREVVLTLSGLVDADNVDPWRQVTDSFSWLP
ncbi:hypothetical protein [Nocardia acidivorans]|uniref:hypothetical protein n=1 Tax=Nocardia acidivorans TaxID=404580 RepID=UPI000B33C41D|nr:hypothetical protein [Nocardia acidivorans]